MNQMTQWVCMRNLLLKSVSRNFLYTDQKSSGGVVKAGRNPVIDDVGPVEFRSIAG
jgi:hypothetical protein